MSNESRYIFKETKDGFRITGRPHPIDTPGQSKALVELAYEWSGLRRQPVEVVRRKLWLEVKSGSETHKVAFCDFYNLVELIARLLLAPWTPPPPDPEAPEIPEHRLGWLPEWAAKRTAWAICKRVHAQWKRLLAGVNPDILAVNNKVFSVSFGYGLPSILFNEELFRRPYVVKDIIRFRAAAMATRICDVWGVRNNPVEQMESWRSVYVPEFGVPYRSLNKTLTGLPGGVPLRLIKRLDQFVLPRPIHNRLELLVTLMTGGRGYRRVEDNFRVFAFAEENQIRKCVELVANHCHWTLSIRRWRDVESVLSFVCDYPGQHRGNFVGLTKKAIDWHRNGQDEVIRRTIETHGELQKVAKPPIVVLEKEGIRFLDTVGQICAEGAEMEHCVASYIDRAMSGESFFFHVDRAGESATVEVDFVGHVTQAQGPRNCNNAAARWGARVLGSWGKQFGSWSRPNPFDLQRPEWMRKLTRQLYADRELPSTSKAKIRMETNAGKETLC
jgi:hypothetical protein